MSGSRDRTSEISTHVDSVRVAELYVGAYNDRDLDAMLAVMDENVVCYPVPLFGHRPHVGHAGVRAWWTAMMASELSFDVAVSRARQIQSDRVVVFGEVRGQGKRLSPWAVVVRIHDDLIVESRSYLSDEDTLANLGLLGRTATGF